MATRVEGRIALKIHGVTDADIAAVLLTYGLAAASEAAGDGTLFDNPVAVDIEVVGVDLVQVVEADDAVSA